MTSPLRILMLSDVYFPRVNGVSTSIQTFVTSLQDRQHEVVLVAPEYPQPHTASFEIVRVPGRRLPLDPEDRLMRLGAVLRRGDALRQRGFDVVHIQTPFVAHYAGLRLARRLGVPVVISYHTFFEAYFEKYLTWVPGGWLRGAARLFSRRQCNAADAVISPSHQMRDRLLEYGVTTPVRVIPTGLQPERFEPPEHAGFRARHAIPPDAPLLLYVGRIAHEKNIAFLLRMFVRVRRAMPDAMLLIAGEGPALESLRRQARRLGIAGGVRFLGYLERATELTACYHASDLFVFASETETQGLVLLEAMASGLPVVATAGMGSLDVLSDGRGCRVSPPDSEGFAARVLALLASPSECLDLGQRGRDYARQWSAQAKAAGLIDLYRELGAGDTESLGGMTRETTVAAEDGAGPG